jgi:ribosomal protein S18 acetylase RimI-like enzyme
LTAMTEPQLRRLSVEDVDQVLAMFHTVHWVRKPFIVEQMIRWSDGGAFCMATPEQILATGFSIPYGTDLAWVSMMATHAAYQRQGFATRIMEAIFSYLREHEIGCAMLDATGDGVALYRKFGFREYCKLEMWVNDAVQADPTCQARHFQAEDLPGVILLDAESFGIERPQMIADFIRMYPGLSWVDEENGEITGFLLAKPRQDGKVKIGPWIHRTPEGAEKLLKAALNAPGGPVVRLYIPESHATAKGIAARQGFDCRLLLVRMIYRVDSQSTVPPFPSMDRQYSIAMTLTG